jgi:high-affinity nickel permease
VGVSAERGLAGRAIHVCDTTDADHYGASIDPDHRSAVIRIGSRSESRSMDFSALFSPFEAADSWLQGLLSGAPFLVALLIAVVLGLRHASDPDHLVAVSSVVAADGGDARAAARLGGWWGLGHAGALLVIGLPVILLKSTLPAWLEQGAERAVGVVILLLALRIVVKWIRGDFRSGRHSHHQPEAHGHRHLRRGGRPEHRHRHVRTPRQAFGIGVLHGLAGTGAVALLLIAALPTQLEAAAALTVFAPMTAVSMALCTTAFAWLLTRPVIEPLYRSVLIPAFGLFGLVFGAWYAGLA